MKKSVVVMLMIALFSGGAFASGTLPCGKRSTVSLNGSSNPSDIRTNGTSTGTSK